MRDYSNSAFTVEATSQHCGYTPYLVASLRLKIQGHTDVLKAVYPAMIG